MATVTVCQRQQRCLRVTFLVVVGWKVPAIGKLRLFQVDSSVRSLELKWPSVAILRKKITMGPFMPHLPHLCFQTICF